MELFLLLALLAMGYMFLTKPSKDSFMTFYSTYHNNSYYNGKNSLINLVNNTFIRSFYNYNNIIYTDCYLFAIVNLYDHVPDNKPNQRFIGLMNNKWLEIKTTHN
jgi:hypothetical protein